MPWILPKTPRSVWDSNPSIFSGQASRSSAPVSAARKIAAGGIRVLIRAKKVMARMARLRKEGSMVLGITRENGNYLGAPDGDTQIRANDQLIFYGRSSAIRVLMHNQAAVPWLFGVSPQLPLVGPVRTPRAIWMFCRFPLQGFSDPFCSDGDGMP